MESQLHPKQPLHRNERILAIDVLRGFALFGIFYAHMVFWFAGGPLPQELYQSNSDPGSGLAVGFYMLFIIGKFFALFSFLFGLGFALQIQSLTRRYQHAAARFAWRLSILGVIGLIHHTFWRADILTIYVPLGFLLLFARNLSDKTLLIIGGLLVLNIPTKLAEFVSLVARGEVELIKVDVAVLGAEYYEVMKNGSLSEMIAHNIQAMRDKFIYQINSGRLIITFGFFLLGMLAGRRQWFEDVASNRQLFKKVWKRAGFTALACVLAGAIIAVALHLAKIDVEKAPAIFWFGGLLLEFFNVSLTLFYITGIALLMLRPRWSKVLAPLAGIGKMALTTYLLQTVFGLLIFCSFGLGLFGETSPAQNALICILVFLSQVVLCQVWLKWFRYGPVEWLWRSATDLRWQPFTRVSAKKSDMPPTAEF